MKSILVYKNDDHKYNDHHDKNQNTKSSSNTSVKKQIGIFTDVRNDDITI